MIELPELPEDAEFPLVEIVWRDAWFDFEQAGREPTRGDYLVKTVGYLFEHDARFASIAMEVLPDGDGFRAVTHIPREIIHSVTIHEQEEA